MNIKEDFVRDILEKEYPTDFQQVYDNSMLIQYLDKKMKAVHSNSKTRRNLANIYAIYSILYFYKNHFYEKAEEYRGFEGYDYMLLFNHYRSLYGGSRLQNHSFNSRVNGEFHNRINNAVNDLIIANNGKYLIHIDYLYVNGYDISKEVCKIIEMYIQLLRTKDNVLINHLSELQSLTDYAQKKEKVSTLLTEDAEARIFEIISYAILKNHYRNIKVYFGYSQESIKKVSLKLYKTGRTNANDGGIDFVMRPVGRFFQVTEVSNYDKYLLDIDKVMHFPITFVIKTKQSKNDILSELEKHIRTRSSGMTVLENRYRKAIEEIITINELQIWIQELDDSDIDRIIRDIDIYFKLEMNMEENE